MRIGHPLGVLLAVGCVHATHASATYPGADGPIYMSNGGDVWSYPIDGSGPIDLTDRPGGPGSGSDPSAASASGRVAFVVGAGPGAEIWTMGFDGSDPRRITVNSVRDAMPAISADGSRIVFVSERGGPGADLWTMNADGSAPAPLHTGPGDDRDPQLTPDESEVVFTTEIGGDRDLAVVPATGGPHATATEITHHALDESQPSLQPDQVRLAYVRDGDIFTAYYNGTDEFPLAIDPTLDEHSPAFSPDGTRVAYAAGPLVYVAAAGGLNPRPLVTSGLTAPSDLDWGVGSTYHDPPETTITKRPRKRGTRRTVRFRFRSSEPGSSFACRLDGREVEDCESPQRYAQLKRRRHRFRVYAIGLGGADPSPAVARFRVLERERR